MILRNDDIAVDSNVKRLKEISDVIESFGLRETYSVIPYGRTVYAGEFVGDNRAIEKLVGDKKLEESPKVVKFLKEQIKKGHHISLHGWKHVLVNEYPDAVERIIEARKYLERLLDTDISLFTPPYNNINYDLTIRIPLLVLLETEDLENSIVAHKQLTGDCYYHWWSIDPVELKKHLSAHYDVPN